MPFTRTNWMNYSPPAINAANLLNMEDGIWYGLAHSGGIRNTAEFLDRNPGSTTGGLAEAIADLGGSPGVIFAAPHNHPINGNYAIPATVYLIAGRGATFTIANGVTLTINGTIEAGWYQIFAGAGSVVFGTSSVPRLVSRQWWGSTNSDGINEALASLPTSGGDCLLGPGDAVVNEALAPPANAWSNKGIIGIGGADAAGWGSVITFFGVGICVSLPDLGAGNEYSNARLKNFAVRDYGGNGTIGLDLNRFSTACIAENIAIRGFDQNLGLTNSWYAEFRHISSTYSRGWGIIFHIVNAAHLTDIKVAHPCQSLAGGGIRLSSCTGVELTGSSELLGGSANAAALEIYQCQACRVKVYLEGNRDNYYDVRIRQNSKAITLDNIYCHDPGAPYPAYPPVLIDESEDILALNCTLPVDSQGRYARIDNCSRVTFLDGNLVKYSIRNATYRWTQSPATATEYYLELAGGGNPGILNPSYVYENDLMMMPGTLGSLAAGEWAYGDNDGLGFNTVYVRLTVGGDPDLQVVDWVEATGIIQTVNLPANANVKQIYGDTIRMYDGDLNLQDATTGKIYPLEDMGWTMLTAPLTSVNWNGNAFGDVAVSTLLDLSVDFGAPAGIQAVLMQVTVRDSGSLAQTSCRFRCGPSAADFYALDACCAGLTNDALHSVLAVVPCDANGDVWYQIDASGAGNMDIWIRIWGYLGR